MKAWEEWEKEGFLQFRTHLFIISIAELEGAWETLQS